MWGQAFEAVAQAYQPTSELKGLWDGTGVPVQF